MTKYKQGALREERYPMDESIFKPRTDTRMQLPGETDLVYEENQPFDQVWLWAILGIELVIILVPMLLTGQPWWAIIMALSVMVLTMALLGSLNLYTRIDAEGIHYRMKIFHWREQHIPWEDIDQIYVRKYSPILEYGGWGIRYGLRRGRAFNVRGNYGIQIVKKNGKRILLGTQKPDEAALHLSRTPLLV